MTNSPTKDPPPEVKPDLAIEPPSTRKTQPGVAVPHAAPEPDLESRIKLRRAELIAKLGELKADVRIEATQACDKLKARLSELAHIIKEGVVDGWKNLGNIAQHKLERWLAESEQSLPGPDLPARSGQS